MNTNYDFKLSLYRYNFNKNTILPHPNVPFGTTFHITLLCFNSVFKNSYISIHVFLYSSVFSSINLL